MKHCDLVHGLIEGDAASPRIVRSRKTERVKWFKTPAERGWGRGVVQVCGRLVDFRVD